MVVAFVGHVQELFWQVRLPVQALPQLPQLLALLARLTQVVPHCVVPVGHKQLPFMQAVVGAVHVLPQPPQLLGSVLKLTQAVGHALG